MITQNYEQSGVFGTVGLITGTFTGTWTPSGGSATSFSVSGSTGNLETSLIGSGATSFTLTTNGVTAITNPVGAGKFVVPQVVLNVNQAGVPITFNVCAHAETGCSGTSKTYTGTFATNGAQTITVNTVTSTTAPVTGNASAHFNIDTTLGRAAMLNGTILAPIDGTPKNTIAIGPIGPVTTGAGAAAQFLLAVALTSGTAGVSGSSGPSVSNVVAGATAFVDVYTADKFGNIIAVPAVSNGLSEQTQISLAATGGSLSVVSAYIPAGCGETNGTSTFGCVNGVNGFGTISWTVPSTVGTVSTLTASGVLGGVSTSSSATVTSVSSSPTISVTSPTPQTVAGVSLIASPTSAVIFTGKAAASVGYPASTTSCASPYVCINTVAYKVNSNTWQTVTVTPGNSIVWSLAATMPAGLSTIEFNASDSKSPAHVMDSSVYTVLVDSQAPTFAFSSATSNTGTTTVTISTAQGDFNTATFVATYGSTTIPTSSISWSGTQTLGTAGSLTATIAGLTTGSGTLTVSGSTYAGVSGTASETLTVTVPFADSMSFTTSSAAYATIGAYSGITIPVTNSWSSAQTIVVFATFRAGTSLYVAQGTTTLNPGQTATVFAIQLQTIPAGTYTVTFSAVTTSNQAVSAPTTPITVVVP